MIEYRNRALSLDKFRNLCSVITGNPENTINEFFNLTSLGDRLL
jgi:hypothetical protein